MGILNERNENTEKVIHLLVTSLCVRNCKHCCNRQYSLNDIPYVTDDELKSAHTICITGGEPFLFSKPAFIASYYKLHYKNIKNVYVYTNAIELAQHLLAGGILDSIDGVNISIKTKDDAIVFNDYLKDNKDILSLESNVLYVFDELYKDADIEGFKVVNRQWQEDFTPADDSIFRKV